MSPEAAERLLRDVMFSTWQRQPQAQGGGGSSTAGGTAPCETYEDTLRFTSLVDFYVPYLPLQREQVTSLCVVHASIVMQML